jgi:Spy/CpxP family protein refolding chaperone
MLTKTKIAGLMVALMALSAPMVYADNGGGDMDSHQAGDWHHGPKDHMFAKILNLSDDQTKQLKDSYKKQKEAMKSLFEQIKTNREALNAEITKATPDMNQVNTIETQLKALQSQMVDGHLNSILEIKKILTPEQFAGYMALKKERELKMHMMGHDKFGHKDGFDKMGDKAHCSDGQD